MSPILNPAETPLVLACLAVLLSGPVPRALLRVPAIRRVPHAATVLWQAVALSAVLSGLGAGLSLVTGAGVHHGLVGYAVALGVLVLTAVVLGRLLLSGHRVGTDTRSVRREHLELVDLLAADDAGVHVLDSDTPTAYCLPGVARSRVVVSAGALGRLAPEEVAAVVAHERAHLRARHDLVLEAFTVLHEAFPRFVSSRAALGEVRLLVEVMADRAACRVHGGVAVARALVALAGSRAPEAALGAAGSGLVTRVELLGDERPRCALAVLVLAAAAAVVVLPTAFVAAPWLASLG